jgi:hypothetical protein
MIGTGRQFLEAAVSQSQSDDSDPLLEFSSERNAVNPVTSTSRAVVQPVAAQLDPAPPPPPSIPIEALVARIDRIESALDESKIQMSSLKSELATLVRAVGDIKRQTPRRELHSPMGLPGVVRAPKNASAILLAALVALTSAVFGWVYFTGSADPSLAGSAAEPQETAFVPSDQPVAPSAPAVTEPSPPPARVVPAARVMPAPDRAAARQSAPATRQATPDARQAATDTRVKYVGALSVDSEPGGEVFLNRESAGHTPLRLDNLRAGSHLIWVERDGYRRWTRVVQVPADRVTRLFADLEPIASR